MSYWDYTRIFCWFWPFWVQISFVWIFSISRSFYGRTYGCVWSFMVFCGHIAVKYWSYFWNFISDIFKILSFSRLCNFDYEYGVLNWSLKDPYRVRYLPSAHYQSLTQKPVWARLISSLNWTSYLTPKSWNLSQDQMVEIP